MNNNNFNEKCVPVNLDSDEVSLVANCQRIKAKVYKECLEKVKNYIKAHCNPYGKPDFDYDTSIKILKFIENLVKEMVGEE